MCIGRVSESFGCGVCTYDYKRVEACRWLFSSLYQVFRLVWHDIPGLQLELYMYSIASLRFPGQCIVFFLPRTALLCVGLAVFSTFFIHAYQSQRR